MSDEREPMFPKRHPCPCGSGKRFKNCCEGEVYVDAARIRAAEDAHPGLLRTMIEALDAEAAARPCKTGI